eukprot:5781277-Pleurochrysis_carterae.AAC.3
MVTSCILEHGVVLAQIKRDLVPNCRASCELLCVDQYACRENFRQSISFYLCCLCGCADRWDQSNAVVQMTEDDQMQKFGSSSAVLAFACIPMGIWYNHLYETSFNGCNSYVFDVARM